MVVNVRGPAEDPGRAQPGQPDCAPESLNDLARDWALCADREDADARFDLVVRAAERQLCAQARNLARRLVGDSDVDDVLSEAWETVWRKNQYDPDRAPFATYFLMIVQHLCLDVLRRRRRPGVSEPAEDSAIDRAVAQGRGLYQDSPLLDDEIIESLADLQGRISAAVEVLDMSDRHRAILRQMVDLDPGTSVPAGGSAAAADGARLTTAEKARARKEMERVRARVGELSFLEPSEKQASALMRKHHSLAAASAASGIDDKDLRDAYAAAKRKTLALFNLESED